MHTPREVCWRCFRPASACVCLLFGDRGRVDNRTEIIILQHPRERLHPLGTARIARLGLTRARYEVAHDGWHGLTRELALPAGSGLLYPHPAALRLDDVPPAARPTALVVLDATWANARKLYQANPWLARLPHFALRPRTPSRYRIRGQPRRDCLSTIEAIAEALKLLEPDTAGIDDLLRVFGEMIDHQLHVRSADPSPRHRRRLRQPRPVPRSLLSERERLIVGYAESTPAGGTRRLVQWAALRPHTGETFERLVRWEAGERPSPAHLAHMQLSADTLADALAVDALAAAWRRFAGPRPLLAAWNQGTLDLHDAQLGAERDTVLLKAAYCNLRHAACGSLEQVVASEGLTAVDAPVRGRAARRLGQTLAVLELLRGRARPDEI